MLCKKSKLNKSIFVALAVVMTLSVFCVNAYAMHTATVLSCWDEITEMSSSGSISTYNENEEYTDIKFVNGYTYTTTKKDVTKWYSGIFGELSVYHCTRNYSVY